MSTHPRVDTWRVGQMSGHGRNNRIRQHPAPLSPGISLDATRNDGLAIEAFKLSPFFILRRAWLILFFCFWLKFTDKTLLFIFWSSLFHPRQYFDCHTTNITIEDRFCNVQSWLEVVRAPRIQNGEARGLRAFIESIRGAGSTTALLERYERLTTSSQSG